MRLINAAMHREEPSVVRLMGGLGNQMFQYAFGSKISKMTGRLVKFDSRHLSSFRTKRTLGLTSFQLKYEEATEEDLKRLGASPGRPDSGAAARFAQRVFPSVLNNYSEKNPTVYSHAAISRNRPTYFVGHWQSYRYFLDLKPDLLEQFVPDAPLQKNSRNLLSNICAGKSVCVNVRRGDFASDPDTRARHGLMTRDYYVDALSRLREQGNFDDVFVFSDDPEWCSENFRGESSMQVVGHEHAGQDFVHYLYLMRHCAGFVIPNSTFGWWAAWLSACPGRNVFAPAQWFADSNQKTWDLTPQDWNRV